MAIAAAGHAGEGATTELANDPVVRIAFTRLLQKSRNGFDAIEHAAFIVRDADGNLSAVEWPEGERNSARWEGKFPAGTIAIAHTHRNCFRDPSKVDVTSAIRARLPIYVITRTQISKTYGGVVEVVLTGEWTPSRDEAAVTARSHRAPAPQPLAL
jgi:hypothetical protein